jgi:3-phenylpropionate/trans-cinnamate dioxygenase ferredoxin reductase subunit
MSEQPTENQVCVVIGASHAGVNLAFNLRSFGWLGEIILFDADPELPYHRPPLSKTYLADEEPELNLLKSADSYTQKNITLRLGATVASIDCIKKTIRLADGTSQPYDKLVLATGARPLIPPISGINSIDNVYPMRSVADVTNIRTALQGKTRPEVVIIGGGYIGLETAASLRKLGGKVTVLEREDRVLARVTAPVMSAFFSQLHTDNGVAVLTGKTVVALEEAGARNLVRCGDGTEYFADVVVLGVGIRVNTELADQAGIAINNGIVVDATAKTSEEDVYAIGDCTSHHNPHYDRYVRLESVQNAVDQAKVAAEAICGKEAAYDAMPWFWSDQYDVKLQIVGLADGYDEVVIRHEVGEGHKFSAWYFQGETLLAVDAVNNAKAYVIGTRFIKGGQLVDKGKLVDPAVVLKPANILVEETAK